MFWIEPVDLGSMMSMNLFIERLKVRYASRLRAVVNCASVAPSKYMSTVDGMELQFQINVIAYYKIMHDLAPVMNRPASIVNVVSGSLKNKQHIGGVSLSALLATPESYNPLLQYTYTKLAEQMLTWDAARRYDIRVNSITPGQTLLAYSKLSRDSLEGFPSLREQRERNCALCWSPTVAGKEIARVALHALKEGFTGTSTLALPGERTRLELWPALNVSRAQQLWSYCEALSTRQ